MNNNPLVVDIIIPARDEQENIRNLMTALPRDIVRHVVLADNDSKDKTSKIAASHGAVVVHEPVRGYGAACMAGISWLSRQDEQPDVVCFVDADLADDPKHLPMLVDTLVDTDADMVIGARRRLADAGSLTIVQHFGNALACSLIAIMTGKRYRDLGPMRVLRWESLQKLKMKDQTWGWTVEMQYKAAHLGMRVQEIDVRYRKRHAGRSKISGTLSGSIRAGWKILSTIGYLRWTMRNIEKTAKRFPVKSSAL